ncbi:MAG: flagellar basal body rod protein FlgB [Oscillospiraceae bacterium]|nr:flagellar basal body rod protein FlgB [Oscillospiraceae bacterium]MBP1568434.1 flagellar basal body rod protein FlgB [Oscillospiraceae bacterium]MBP1590768.1 flagellar basal body rod protein FlgB [Oscillospiraceae bacterium]MBQ5335868.1 flagellar basal body rod protein FlgB [Oscillospiraceae bacterium]
MDSFQFKAMESGIKAMSIKQQVHTQNIANLDTPDYKVKTFSFGNTLENQMKQNTEKDSMEYDFEAKVETKDNVEVLVDGNNVDIENENLELYSAYIQQAATIQKMNAVISDYRYVLQNASFK